MATPQRLNLRNGQPTDLLVGQAGIPRASHHSEPRQTAKVEMHEVGSAVAARRAREIAAPPEVVVELGIFFLLNPASCLGELFIGAERLRGLIVVEFDALRVNQPDIDCAMLAVLARIAGSIAGIGLDRIIRETCCRRAENI